MDAAIGEALAKLRTEISAGRLPGVAKLPTLEQVRFCVKRRKVDTEAIFHIISSPEWPLYYDQRVKAAEAAKVRRRETARKNKTSGPDEEYELIAVDDELPKLSEFCDACHAKLDIDQIRTCTRVCAHVLCPPCILAATKDALQHQPGCLVTCPSCVGQPRKYVGPFVGAIPADAHGLIDPEFVLLTLATASETEAIKAFKAGKHVRKFVQPNITTADPAVSVCQMCACLSFPVGSGMTRCAGCATLACVLCHKTPHPGFMCQVI